MTVNHVAGQDRGSVMLYALSTCGWCKKTKALLGELKVAYDYTDVDLLDQAEKRLAMEEVRKWNPACSFPSMVINGSQCIVGFSETKIREALKK
jgi:glutaredoxin